MTTLPSAAEAGTHLLKDNADALDLYETVILPAEKAASDMEATADDNNAKDSASSMRTAFSRVVGYLLLYPPSDQARAVVQGELERCRLESDPDEAVYDLGKMYVKDLILPFYFISDEMTPQPTGLDSREAYDLIKDRARRGRLNIPHDTAEAKNFAAARDDFRCMVSRVGDYLAMQNGIIDIPVENRRDEPHRGQVASGRMWWTVAECCHIFPEYLEVVPEYGGHVLPLNVAENHAEAFWEILGRFGYGHIRNELRGHRIHRLENVMTLAGSIHALFRSLDVWFEPDRAPDPDPDEDSDEVSHCWQLRASEPTSPSGSGSGSPRRRKLHTYMHAHSSSSRTARTPADTTPSTNATAHINTNTYRVGASSHLLRDRFDPPIPERVHFVASAPGLPLPDPTYLHVHAACCRVNHLSGAWRLLKPLFWEEVRRMEDDRLGRARAFLDAEANANSGGNSHGHGRRLSRSMYM